MLSKNYPPVLKQLIVSPLECFSFPCYKETSICAGCIFKGVFNPTGIFTFKSLSSAFFYLGYEIFLPLSPFVDWINGVTSIFSCDFAGSRVIKAIDTAIDDSKRVLKIFIREFLKFQISAFWTEPKPIVFFPLIYLWLSWFLLIPLLS